MRQLWFVVLCLTGLGFGQGACRKDYVFSKNSAGALAPAANVSVAVYLYGTTTPADLYAEPTLATPLANPLRTNASGEYGYCVSTASGAVQLTESLSGTGIVGREFKPVTVGGGGGGSDPNAVKVTGDQAIAGNKTFTGTLAFTGTPTADTDAATVGYVTAHATASNAAPAGSVVIWDGDSLTAASSLSAGQKPSDYAAALPFLTSATTYNVAVAGQSCAQRASAYPTDVRPHKPTGGKPGYYILLCGWNGTGATTYDDILALWTLAKADGFTVIGTTMPPDKNMNTDTLEGYRQTANAKIRQAVATSGGKVDYILDLDYLLSNAPNDAALVWAGDGRHLSATANYLWAAQVNATLTAGYSFAPAQLQVTRNYLNLGDSAPLISKWPGNIAQFQPFAAPSLCWSAILTNGANVPCAIAMTNGVGLQQGAQAMQWGVYGDYESGGSKYQVFKMDMRYNSGRAVLSFDNGGGAADRDLWISNHSTGGTGKIYLEAPTIYFGSHWSVDSDGNFMSDVGANFSSPGKAYFAGGFWVSGTQVAIDSAGKYNAPLATPANSSAACTAGQMWADTGYIYVCTATNTIKRAALSTF